MVAVPPPIDPQSIIKLLAAGNNQNLSNLLSTLPEGQLLSFMVKANPSQGPGLLLFQGQTIKATLPPEVQSGDKVLAQLSKQNNQLIFKLVEVTKAQSAATSVTARANSPTLQAPLVAMPPSTSDLAATLRTATKVSLANTSPIALTSTPNAAAATPNPHSIPLLPHEAVLISQLETALKNYPPPQTRSFENYVIPQSNEQPQEVAEHLERLVTIIGSQEALADPKALTEKLASITDGKLLTELRETIRSLTSLIQEQSPPSPERFFSMLKEEISMLLRETPETLEARTPRIRRLIQATEQEFQADKPQAASKNDKALTRLIISDLKMAAETPEQSSSHLEAALTRLTQFSAPSENTEQPTIPKNTSELQTLLTRLEQMVASQETLNRMNPVMQALGEPALLLFPFVIQGLLNHTEIRIDPDQKRNQQQHKSKDQKDSEESDGSSPDTTPYQRVQLSVPLPNIGTVGVDLAHRHEELLIRLTVEDEETGRFLLEQSEHLASYLRQHDFVLKEFAAEVGKPKNQQPDSRTLGENNALTIV